MDDGGYALQNVFDFVEKLVLPNWAEDRCPWCAEGEQFKRMREAQHAEPLSSTAEGMDRDIFIVPNGCNSLELKRGSFVGPPSLAQSNIFCVIAVALQLLRTERVDETPLLGEQYFLIKPVLNVSYYLRYRLGKRGLLRLRTCRRQAQHGASDVEDARLGEPR